MTDTFVRLLVCHHCQTIQEIPDYDGPPEYDSLLEYRVAEHRTPGGTPHQGILARAKASDWEKEEYKQGVLREINEAIGFTKPGTGEGLGSSFYNVQSTFKADAFTCWKHHNRTENCQDYRSDAKELLADTKAERKAEGMSTARRDRPKHWLCDYCPVHSLVQQRQRKQAGLYN